MPSNMLFPMLLDQVIDRRAILALAKKQQLEKDPAVARLIGAGNLAAAMDRGRDGIWLGLLLGAVLAVLGWPAAPALTAALGATGEVQAHAVAYLRWSMPGLPALLAVLAATGVLRGLQDTVTPLVVAGVGFGANIGLNVALVYGLGWGVAGSAIGTSVVQWASGWACCSARCWPSSAGSRPPR